MVDVALASRSAFWVTVTPEFVFLLALPPMVAIAGLTGDVLRRRRGRG